ncbi:protein phosphatase 1 regulatory subunit 14B-like [Macrobrachium nipponense]|uniref:protein phosphatase 1 regulatory subunit 14B-like n=1 Tax=Macrobrachium nipponense TaxID=159736 RepID=UPI0030C81702
MLSRIKKRVENRKSDRKVNFQCDPATDPPDSSSSSSSASSPTAAAAAAAGSVQNGSVDSCGVGGVTATSPSPAAPSTGSNSGSGGSDPKERLGVDAHQKESTDVESGMEVGVASYTSGPVGGSPDRARGPPRANLHVEFAQLGEVKERKEKYLTAKYGAHQMSLIRKRLGVEMWMFDQLQSLYPTPEGKHEEKELDLDELLDIEGELKRKKFLWDSLADCKQSKDKVEKFIDELLERATTL